MAYSIDFAATLKSSRTDNQKRPAGFPANATEKAYSFGESLKDAERTVNREERPNLKKELVAKAESKLKNWNKPQKKTLENPKINEDDKALPVKQEQTIEQLFSNLEELVNMQTQENASKNNTSELMQSIKETIAALTEVQVKAAKVLGTVPQQKASELAAVLGGMLEQLKTNGSINVETAEDFEAILNTLMSQLPEETKQMPITSADVKTTKALSEKHEANGEKADTESYDVTISNSNEAKVHQADKKEAIVEGKASEKVEAVTDNTVEAALTADVKLTGKGEKKTTEAASETEETEIKSALDSKVEKVEVKGKEDKQQGEESENNKKEDYKAPQKTSATMHKLSGEELNSIRLSQQAEAPQVETVTKQTAARPEILNKAEVINQIVKKAEVVITDARPEIRMQLEPENLGKLSLKLAVEKGLITAKFVAESFEVKQLIESSFNELRDMLQEKGLEVQNFSVSVGQENKEYNNSSAFQQWKETVRANGRSTGRVNYTGYEGAETTTARPVNPYNIHNGNFDHRA